MPFKIRPTNGLVTARDRSELDPSESQTLTGYFYKAGDGRIHRIGGRSTFGDTASAAKVKGLALCKYDSGGTDRLLAYSGTTIYSATPGATGSWSSFITSLNASGANLTKVHYNDTWYIGNGYDYNRAISSSGGERRMGMIPPPSVTAAATTAGTVATRPTATQDNTGWTDVAKAYDTTDGTYAYASQNSAGTDVCTWKTWGSSTAANRRVNVTWALAGLPPSSAEDPALGASEKAYNVTVTITYSTDDGVTYANTLYTGTHTGAVSQRTSQSAVLAVNSNLIRVKITLTYNSGVKTATLRAYDIYIADGGTTPVTTSTGLYYGVTEYDSTNGIESSYAITGLVTLSGQTEVTLTLPSSTQNTNTTRYNIYRTTDGGTAPQDLRLIGEAASTATAWVDTFTYGKDTAGTSTLPLIKVQTDPGADALYFPSNEAPPAFNHMNAYGPFLIGLTPEFPRQLYYSLPGFPEYWPAIYVVQSFPLAERDELISTAVVGDSLIVGAKEAILILDGLPEASGGVFIQASSRVMRGQPGCVGVNAMCSFSVNGEARGAWVSPFGVHETNGQMAHRISEDIDWDSTVTASYLSSAVLHWDSRRTCLVFSYDSTGDGVNDKWYLIHVAETKPNGQPKWTGPHDGKIQCLESGLVSGTHRMWSGHGSNGIVYLEDDRTVGTDSSQSYSSTTLRSVWTGPRLYNNHSDWSVDVANLYHTSFGSSQTGTLAWTAGNDFSSTTDALSKTVSLETQKGTEIYIARAAEWHEFTLTYTGTSNTGAIQGFWLEADRTDTTGET